MIKNNTPHGYTYRFVGVFTCIERAMPSLNNPADLRLLYDLRKIARGLHITTTNGISFILLTPRTSEYNVHDVLNHEYLHEILLQIGEYEAYNKFDRVARRLGCP